MLVPRRRLSFIAAACLLAGLLVAGVLVFVGHMHRTLSGAAGQVAASHRIPYSLALFRPATGTGFALLRAKADLRSAAVLAGDVYASGPGELLAFGGDGVEKQVWRPGLELPGAALGPVTAVRLRGAARAQLALGTAGAGVLVIDTANGQVAQMLPRDSKWRDVTALAALPDGELILGTRRGGVLDFDGETLSVYRPELVNVAVTALLATADGLWVGTQNDGVYLVGGGTARHFSDALPDLHIETLAEGGGRVFAGTPDGVAEFEAGQPERTLAEGVFVHALWSDGRTLSVAALEGGTVEVPLGAVRGMRTAASGAGSATDGRTQQFLRVGSDEDLYAVRADGVYRRRGAGWARVLAPSEATLADRNVSALAFAPDGRLWVGYFDRGLDVLDPVGGRAQHMENDRLFCVNRIEVDPRRETMAVATANGLVLFDRAGAPRQVLGRRDGLISEHVTDVAFEGDTMTVATAAGLSFVGPDGVESLYAFEGLVNNHVYAVAVAPEGGQLVAGTLGGLSLLEHGAVWRNVTTANSGLRHNWITAVLPLPRFAGGGYLLGTYGGGLMRMSPAGEFPAMDGAETNGVISPNAVLATETHVYAGSMGDGLWVYGRESQRWQRVTAGLPSLNVTALAARNGELYVGTDNGVVHVPEARLPV